MFGSNLKAALGFDDVDVVATPRRVDFFAGRRVDDVACGAAHTLALCEGGVFRSPPLQRRLTVLAGARTRKVNSDLQI